VFKRGRQIHDTAMDFALIKSCEAKQQGLDINTLYRKTAESDRLNSVGQSCRLRLL
jgi:hypothetical protein